jgi:hypothetical protein
MRDSTGTPAADRRSPFGLSPLPVRLAIYVLLLVVGLVLVIREGHLLLKSSQSDTWLSTDGVIKSAEKQEWLNATVRHRLSYRAAVTYDYVVDHKTLTGNRIRLERDASSFPFAAEEYLKKYRVGTPVKVFYSATDPSDSVLEPGVSAWNWLLPAVGCVLVAFASFMIAAAARESRR